MQRVRSSTIEPFASHTVVVVDADPTARASCVEMLRTAGYRVSEVASFQEARHVLESMHPDLLIADIRLREFNGLHLVWRRFVESPQGPSIVTNTYADPVLERQARAFNAPYLVKPVSRELLLSVVARALGDLAGRVVDPERSDQWRVRRSGRDLGRHPTPRDGGMA